MLTKEFDKKAIFDIGLTFSNHHQSLIKDLERALGKLDQIALKAKRNIAQDHNETYNFTLDCDSFYITMMKSKNLYSHGGGVEAFILDKASGTVFSRARENNKETYAYQGKNMALFEKQPVEDLRAAMQMVVDFQREVFEKHRGAERYGTEELIQYAKMFREDQIAGLNDEKLVAFAKEMLGEELYDDDKVVAWAEKNISLTIEPLTKLGFKPGESHQFILG